MQISLSKDGSSQPDEILVRVQVSASDDPAEFTYSHSFRYKVPSGMDGEIIVYADRVAAFKDVNGVAFSFNLEECNNLECHKVHCQEKHKHCEKKIKDCEDCKKEITHCKKTNKHECPVIAGKFNRLLVADVFHTMPTYNTLQCFGTALFKALFSGEAGRILQGTKSTHPNGSIFLLLSQDLDAIPWEYAKDGTSFLVHHRKFTRLLAYEYQIPRDPLPQLPLHILVVTPNPLDLPKLGLTDLRLDDRLKNFIDELRGDPLNVILERVLPATVREVNSLIAKPDDKMASVLHFMGHCVTHKKNRGRGLLFEDGDNFKCMIANTQSLITVPGNLRLAFLSACDSREVARDLAKNGVRHTIGLYCSLPDDIAHKSEAQCYYYLSQGLSVDEAMWRTRMYFSDSKELRQSDYLAGALILYSTTWHMADSIFLCEAGELTIKPNMSDTLTSKPSKSLKVALRYVKPSEFPASATQLSSIPDIQNWNKEQVVEHLRSKFPNDVSEAALNILLDNEIGGRAFLGLTKEDLMSDGIKRGSAYIIADYVKKLNDAIPDGRGA